ncbi:MAG TPA: adenylate/guanylate cyclase domain-containing protein, partial [Roseiflexaceae bacterium]|nr:adenylate/guanylate cyclase domain-containing protein [Roseiflexaceae bacterium]
SDTDGNSLAARLRDHLAPELLDRLTHTGALPPDVVAAECTRLRADLAAIATYIPSTVVREQLADPAPGRIKGDYWEGSVLFADLSGFTALSEKHSSLGKQGAEEVSAIINNLFGAMLEELHRYRGGLLKFGGDAITAFFDAATLDEQHAALACRAALAMQARMAEFAALATRAGSFQLRLRIGVHSGRVFAAQVGDIEHVELVVTGRNINRVALAQEIAEPGEVVVSNATLTLLDRPTAEERQSGFYLLRAALEVDPPPATTRWGRKIGLGDMKDLLALGQQIEALRPYLPRGLPRRFLASADGGAEAGEFRPVTVLFANFFPFSQALDILGDDVDTAARVLNAYYRRAQEVVHRYGGIVNKVDMYTFGDKLMALFGAPTAHEDDPVRAARAALELRAALTEANAEIDALLQPQAHLLAIDSPFLKQRIGINTGQVFAGQVGPASRHEYTVMGQHVNLAARLMSAAEEGAIVLSPSTRRAVERHIALRELPPVKLKGIADPVPIAEALHPFEVALELRRGLNRAPLVGRDAEMARLIDEARAAFGGSGRVVALVGEAGAGKSRLIEDVLQQLVRLSGRREVRPFFPYSAECQSYNQNTPYAVVRELLRQFLNLSLAGSPTEEAATLSRRVHELAPDMERFTPLLGDILGLPLDDTPLTAALTPQQRHDRAQELIEALLLAGAQRQPLLLIVDDLHWGDASSLDMLTQLARAAARGPLLILLGYRLDPPIAEPWRELEHCTRLEIRELPAAGSIELVRALLRGEPPAELTALIEKAQGNPFFVEEVVRSLIDSGALEQQAGTWQLTRTLDEAAVPDSIEGVITARLDRLEERSREVLQVASVIGRRFHFPVLSGLVLAPNGLHDRLRWLAEADLILSDEIEREIAFLFKHALTRDVAYESILYARRRDLHRRVAQQLEQLHPDRPDEQLALLARHYLLAEEYGPAFDYHLRAGRQAQSSYANREAITLYERAILIAQRLEPGTKNQEPNGAGNGSRFSVLGSQVVELHERLGVVYALIGEYDSALERYLTALDLLLRQPEATLDEKVRLHHHIARVYEKRAEFETAFEWVERAMALAGDAHSRELVRCLLLGAGLHLRQGRNNQTLEWAERALSLAEELGSLRSQAEAFMHLGSAYSNLGDNTRAFELTSRSLQLYEQAQDLTRLADVRNNLAIMAQALGRMAEARAHFEASAEITQAMGDVYTQGMIANNLGDLLKLQGDLDEAIAQFSKGLAIYERLGSHYATGVLQMNLGATYLLRGDLDIAERHLGRSAELYDQVGAEDFLPELERYLAALHLRRGDIARARLACEMSLANAARLEARAEEGATRRTLAQILAQDGDLAGAWEELERSLAILREAASAYEIAQTLLAQAALAPALGRRDAGQAALDEALPILREIGAQRDSAEAREIAIRQGYVI